MRIEKERSEKSVEALRTNFEKEVEKRVSVQVGVRHLERENALREELVTLADKWDEDDGTLQGEERWRMSAEKLRMSWDWGDQERASGPGQDHLLPSYRR